MATPGESDAAARARVAAKKATLEKARAALRPKGLFDTLIPQVSDQGVYINKMDPVTGTDRRIGFMELYPKNIHGDREISMIQVSPEERGKGIASAMYTYAKRQGLNPVHSANRTPAGEAFAKSTGDYAPPNEGPNIKPPRMPAEKAASKLYGAQRAKEIAIAKAKANLSKVAGKLNGAGGILSFLPMLMLGGMAATGKYVDPKFAKPSLEARSY